MECSKYITSYILEHKLQFPRPVLLPIVVNWEKHKFSKNVALNGKRCIKGSTTGVWIILIMVFQITNRNSRWDRFRLNRSYVNLISTKSKAIKKLLLKSRKSEK